MVTNQVSAGVDKVIRVADVVLLKLAVLSPFALLVFMLFDPIQDFGNLLILVTTGLAIAWALFT